MVGVRPQQSSGDTGGIGVLAGFIGHALDRVVFQQQRSIGSVHNDLWEWDHAIGGEANDKCRIFAGFITLQRFGQVDAQDTGEDFSH